MPIYYPLTPTQRDLYLDHLLDPRSTTYSLGMSLDLGPAVDEELWREAVRFVVEREEVPRTRFVARDGEPCQVFDPEVPFCFERLEGALPDVVASRIKVPYELDRGSLFRSFLVRDGASYAAALAVHHAVCDAYSGKLFFERVGEAYEALSEGRAPVSGVRPFHASIPASIGRFDTPEIERYWTRRFADASPYDELTASGMAPAARKVSLRGARLAAVRDRCAENGWSLAGYWRTLFGILLHRFFGGGGDLLLYDVVSGRSREERSTIGCFYHVVPVVLADSLTSPRRAISGAVGEIGRYRRGLGERQNVSVLLQRRLAPPGGPRFFFNYYNFAVVDLLGSRSILEVHDSFPEGEVHLVVSDQGDALELALHTGTAPLSGAGFPERLVTLSDQVLAGARRVGELDVLPAAERRRLVAWNATTKSYGEERDLRTLLARPARRTPEAIAVSFEEGDLSYRELHRRAGRLAGELRRCGVGPDVVVGVFMERSLELMVALVAVFEAGGAYLPLDPDYPRERLAFMLEDAAVPVVLTGRRWLARVPGSTARVLAVDGLDESGTALLPLCPTGPENLAYVIYTSGSTGRPKGVMTSHGAISNRLLWMQDAYGLDANDRVLQKTPASFDVSVWELFWPLVAGARLVLARPGGHRDPAYLARLIRQRRITTLHFVPSMFRVFVDQAEGDFPGLKRVITSGEALPPVLRDRYLARCDAELHNLYGPTEAAVDVTFWPCRPPRADSGVEPEPGTVPIGFPIANTHVHVQDRRGARVPVARPGELVIGGVAPARGYHRRRGLTARRFVPDPWSGAPGGRLYRTGDLARRRPDGGLEFLGRLDHQVKVRGFRVELGEVEAALAGLDGVSAAAVTARLGAAGDTELVAYLVAAGGAAPAPAALRRELTKSLPGHMVPVIFVPLAELPLTPSGKVDRRALPEPEPEPQRGGRYVAPRTAAEKLLARYLGELLGRERLGVYDEIFELGAHSLIFARLVARLRQETGVELSLPEVFGLPTVAALAGRFEAASAGAPAMPIPALRPTPRDGELRLSFAQERVWFLHQMAPGNVAYNIQFLIHWRGRLDHGVLERSLSEIVRRHEILRTGFPARDGRPVQVVHEPFAVEVPRIDLGRVPASRRREEMAKQVRRAISRPFDVRRPPLARWILFHRAAGEHTLLQIEHHFVHDGWSVAVLLRELRAIYEALAADGEMPPAPEAQYADFVAWQRRWIAGEVLEEQLAYWKEQLSGCPPLLELPADRPRPERWSFRGDALIEKLPADLYGALRDFSRREGVTLFTTMTAAFTALLHRTTGQADVPLGSGFANRRLRELESMIGMVVNSVVLRADLGGNPDFRGLLARVRQTILEAHRYQDLPFEKLVEALRPERDPSYNPLFQVMFGFHDSQVPDLDFAGLSGRFEPFHNGSAKSDLNIVVIPRAEQRLGLGPVSGREEMLLVWEYGSDLFDRTTMRRLFGHYRTLLRGAAADPRARLTELPLLAAAERQELVVEWADRPRAGAARGGLHGLLEAWARRRPDAVALEIGDESLSFAELDARADRLAEVLRARGLGPEKIAGVLMERSLDLVSAMFAVFKAGGVYLPLDPRLPEDRLAFMLADARAVLLIAGAPPPPRLSSPGLAVVRTDGERDAAGRRAASVSSAQPPPAQAAYTIYTSGSTGRPNGVVVSHGAAVRHLAAARQVYGLNAEDRMLHTASFSFDAALEQLLGPLSSGAKVVLTGPGPLDPSGLSAVIRKRRATVVNLPPAAWSAWVEALPSPSETLADLRLVIVGGDVLPPRALRRWRGSPLARIRALNAYGPTEATVTSTLQELRELSSVPERIPIGRALGDRAIRLLDRAGQPAAIGVPGELAIGGSSLGRGYGCRPRLTAERFVPDAPADLPGDRLYRSGDLARRLPDGVLELLGRTDFQVQIRGFRIEPGEVEARLVELPGVREAVVSARGGEAELPGLVAWVVSGVSERELRDALREKLPAHMVPSHFVALDGLPRNESGKVDRRALPPPVTAGAAAAAGFAAPGTGTEEVLAQIWAEVLGLGGNVGAEDSFFDLGGHSLLATRVASRIRQIFAIELPLGTLFEAPTVRGLARRIETAAWSRPAPPIERSRETDPRLSFAQQRLWFLDRLAPDNPFYNLPFAWTLNGPLEVPVLARCLDEIRRRHAVLRTRFPERGGEPFQSIEPPRASPLPIASLTALAPEARRLEAGKLASAEIARPFDLARDLPLRATLVRLGREQATLLLTLHHIVADGWSVGVLLGELRALYEAFAAGRPSPLPELPIQYADFAAWQRRWLAGEVLERQLGYWRRRLAGAPVVELPADRPRPAVQTFRGRRLETRIRTRGELDALEALGREHGATLFMVLLAAFEALLHRLTGQDDVVVGSPIANRTRTEVEGLIGFFVNSLAMRCDLSGDPRLTSLVEQVREVALGAYAHQDLPFEKLVAYLEPDRDLGRNPIFQVVLAVQNAPAPARRIGPLTLERQPFEARVTRFDLEAQLWSEPDGLRMVLYYDSDLFDPSTLVRFERHFRALLDGAAEPGGRLSELPLLRAAETHQLLAEWSRAAAGLGGTCVHERVERHAALHGGDDAVVSAWERLSYAELNERANRLAHHLRSLGAGPESLVALLMEPCPEMIWGLLGVLKSGAAYVPLDPSYPGHRLAFMLRDAGPRALLTAGGDVTEVEGWAGPVLALDMAWDVLDRESGDDPPRRAAPEQLAYVIYTSGSTGRPKGVALTHRGLANLVSWHQGAYGLGPGDRATQIAGPGFDASVWEIWSCLGAGASLYVPDPETRLSPPELVEWLAGEEIDVAFLPTPLAEAVLREDGLREAGLRALLTGGDRLHRSAAAAARVPLFNHYGPTENTVVATAGRVVAGAGDPPIGRPVAGVRTRLLDRRLGAVPVGAFGELSLGGTGLARGYLGRPGLTAGRFVPDPFAPLPGERLYVTGDLARALGDGRIEFLGRRDHQVKIRGYRIELGEIEAVLEEHPAVRTAVAVNHGETGDGAESGPLASRLVGYVVPSPDYRGPEAGIEDQWQRDQVAQWEMIFDDLYGRDAPRADASFNTIGWNDTATGEPIPEAEMREWLDDTIRGILDLGPRRLLEIGCGTGMVLFGVAPHLADYHGTDISQRVIAELERRRAAGTARGPGANVTLSAAPADDFRHAPPGRFDTVVLNSVVQYFPSIDYLVKVLEGAVEAVADGGAVFLGDVRSLPLLAAFHAHVALARAGGRGSVSELARRARAGRLEEDELVVDPAFFRALGERLPRIGRVEVFPKRGAAVNELTSFRYQVVLRVGEPAAATPAAEAPAWLDWRREVAGLEALGRRLEAGAPDLVGLSAVPNARLDRASAILELIDAVDETATVAELCERLPAAGRGGVDPESLRAVAGRLGYAMDWSWARHRADGSFDVLLRRRGTAAETAAVPWPEPSSRRPLDASWSVWANQPLRGRLARRMLPELRSFLAERLPDHMVPARWVLLDELPLTANGKVDRRALPEPAPVQADLEDGFVAPRTPQEEALARIWSGLLDVEQIGVHDDFFERGGHSLLATQVISQIRQRLGCELPLAALFETPTIAGLAERVAEVALPDALARPELPAIERRHGTAGELPLSFAQQRLWFLDRLASENSFYNIPLAWGLEGPLDAAVLRRSLREIARRHEVLRTRFPSRGGQPLQVVSERPELELPEVDLCGLPGPARRAETSRLVNAEAVRLFDLARDTMIRATLVATGRDEAALLLTLHHIVSDGWSIGVLLGELQVLYPAFKAGLPSPLPELAIQYADFALWQRRWLAGEVLERQLDYWRRRLAGVPILELPTDRPRPAVQTFRGRRLDSRLPARLLGGLKAVGQRQDATLFMTLLGAFNVLLYRYTAQTDLVIGSPIANRNRAEIEGLIGFFVNSLALRSRVRGGQPFTALLKEVRETALGAYAHQDLPFEMLVEKLQPERDLSRNPLFQVSFGLHSAPMPRLAVADLTIRQLPWDLRSTRFDLEFHLWESVQGIRCVVSYDLELFDDTTAERVRRHFEILLDSVASGSGVPVDELPLIAPSERAQLLSEWNDRRECPPAPALPSLFEARAARAPEAAAVTFGEAHLTYRELDRRAGALAQTLRLGSAGGAAAAAEPRVALLIERSLDLVCAILGVSKAGAAYVPLDPTYPRERLGFILDDCGAAVLLAERDLIGNVPAERREKLDVRCLDGEWRGERGPSSTVGAERAAYVIYTSGSTGRPKGTPVSHRAVTRLFAAGERFFGFGAEDTWTLFHSAAFDFSVWELWGALLYGGRLVVVPYWESRSPERLLELLERQRVTVLNQTPSAFRQLVRAEGEAPRAPLPALSWVVFGGEALDPRLLEPWIERHGDRRPRLVNMYGITETTVHVTWKLLERADLEAAWRSPLGVPLPDLAVHLLDRRGRPVPIGVGGELCVAGAGVARGYLGRPGLTAERFVPDALAPRPGGRLYRSGDLARRLAGGELSFLGRADDQVKLRGFRVEPGEIAAVLREHPAVREAVVTLAPRAAAAGGERRLAAYVVREAATDLGAGEAERGEEVGRWRMVFDDLYSGDTPPADPTFDIAGWTSHVTGEAIPAAEMREWLDDTVAAILALEPRRVLEIGCGTGMLLYRVAPRCERYLATDFSRPVLARLESRMKRGAGSWDHVELRAASAEDFTGVEPASFDTVVLNSVVQYFPSVDYLLEVLRRAVRAVAPGGAVFLGDLRSLPLLEAFHALAELGRAADDQPLDVLSQRVRTVMGEEEELVLDPAFFAALERRLPGVGRVEVFPKRGRSVNELTCFRYQAVLRVGETVPAAEELVWQDWRREAMSLGELGRRLREEGPAVAAFRNVPNARLARARAILERLEEPGGLATAGELRRGLVEASTAGVLPEDLDALADGTPYRVELGWAGHGADGCFDAVLRRTAGSAGSRRTWSQSPPLADPRRAELPWRAYASDPLGGRVARRLVPELRRFLAERLPEHMVPASYVWLEELPLTAHGKLDRGALPAPEPGREGLAGRFVAPRDAAEESLAAVWAEVLGVERVGVDDDFFALGGHSLLATRVVSRIRQAFGVELALRVLFESPTVAGLARSLATEAGPGLAPPIRPLARPDGLPRDDEGGAELPLSFAQQRLWFVDRLTPGNAFYNMPIAWVLRGALDPAALARALNEIVRRHEALRTRLPSRQGRARQLVEPAVWRPLPVIDLGALEEDRRRAETRRLTTREALRPFDLAAGPLVRRSLVRRAARDSTLLLTLHHVVADGWSIGVLLHELRELYGAFAAGRPSPLPELAVQYADFAVWQRRWLRGEVLERQLDWWRGQLAGAPMLELPADRPRRKVQTFRGRAEVFLVPGPITTALDELGRARGATLFMTLLAAFGLLLHRLTGQDDLVVGSPIANRHRAELEGLIGFFVNSLALRSRISGDPSFAGLLGEVRETALGAFGHQDLPFEKLVEHLETGRDLSRNPLFQVIFALQNAPLPVMEMGGVELLQQPYEVRTTRFDLEVHFWQAGDGLRGVFFYDLDLFDRTTVRRWQGCLGRLLEAVARGPSIPASRLAILSAAERRQIAEWNDRASAYPREATLDRLFAAQVDRSPDAPAVDFGGDRWSYRELGERVERAAAALAALGCGPEVPVGLCAERSAAAVAALLGIVRAGGSYVPLDPSYPAARLAFMIEDTAMPFLVADRRLAAGLPRHGARVVWLDELGRNAAAAAPETGPAAADRLAYVIYTSGSTGRAKGVAVSHRAVGRLVLETDYVRLRPGDRVAQASTISFDAATFEIWGPLLNGACVVGVDKETALAPRALAAALADRDVSVLFLTTALFNEIVRQTPRAFAGLAHLLFGGETVDPARVRELLASGPPQRLLHVYGPTESTTFATWQRVRAVGPGAPTVPIGRAIANTAIEVLDRRGRRVPPGAVGELAIGGDGLARGYLRRPGLTAERFVPDRHGAEPGRRSYRTGDLVRWRPAGEIEFIGRRDHQVKIRGFRIELGEVEAALERHGAVRRAVALARSDAGAGRRLAAYIVPEPDYRPLEASAGAAEDPVAEWEMIFDDLYRRDCPQADGTFNTIGWDDTATGEPIPAAEMRQWLDDTLARLGALEPRRVLEIGCGTGMLLFPIAPRCELYVGTDVSRRALDYVETVRRATGGGLPQARLEQRSAEDFSGIEPGSFDAVVLNSVVQYFPGADYLAEVLEGAVRALAPGGAIFLGDVRSRPLAEAFQALVARLRAAGDDPPEAIVERARRAVLEEEELLVDPAFFFALERRVPRIERVEVFPKRGAAHNELTRFRYQVVLHVAPPDGVAAEPADDLVWLDWREEGLSLDELCRRLADVAPDVLALAAVPNARIAPALEALGRPAAGGAVDPQELWDLARELPYDVELSWARHGADGAFDACFRRRGSGAARPRFPEPAVDVGRPLGAYATNPLAGRFARRMVPLLRAHLADLLPDHMVPAAWVPLAELPLNANGKVDRRALPAPDRGPAEASDRYAAPRSPLERRLAEIWSELLGVARVGVDDDFFELGGHSLLATQVISRVRDAFGVEIPLGRLFEGPTVSRLAVEVEAKRWARESEPPAEGRTADDLEEIVL